jgi:hypothetical protein
MDCGDGFSQQKLKPSIYAEQAYLLNAFFPQNICLQLFMKKQSIELSPCFSHPLAVAHPSHIGIFQLVPRLPLPEGPMLKCLASNRNLFEFR